MNGQREKISKPRWQPSLRGYLILMNVILLCLLFPTISIFYFQKTSEFRDEQLERTVKERTAGLRDKAAQLIRSISHSSSQAIAGYNYTFLNELIREAVTEDSEFMGCQVISQNSTGTESAGFGFMGYEENPDTFSLQKKTVRPPFFPEEEEENELLPVVYADIKLPSEGGEPVGLMATSPVYVGGRLWGRVNASFSLEAVNRDITAIRNEWADQMHKYKISFLIITIFFILTGVISTIILTRPLLHSISLVKEGVDRVSGGNLEYKIYFNGLACDEFVGLSNSYNEMTESLLQARKQLDDYSRSLEDLVAERTLELKETQNELLAQAHEAGMAEMAVGVLHNIGNAITPVKVVTASLVRRMMESPLRTRLRDTLEKIPEAVQALPDMPDEQKQRIATVLKLLPASISEEYDNIITEIKQIDDKHRYIEKVINLQMHYARLKGRAELVDVNRVAQDALKMLSEVIEKHDITVETSFHPVGMVRLEEGKLVQILVNLIKNGCEAMSGTRVVEKKLFIKTARNNEQTKTIVSVRDTGCGFTPEEQKNFFSFGFSTKKRGSGFGLHSSANYLIANNGTIEARSEGPDRGAEFIVTLPAAEERT